MFVLRSVLARTGWRDGQMALPCCAAGTVEASSQFHRVNGHLHLPALRTELARHVVVEHATEGCSHQQMSAT